MADGTGTTTVGDLLASNPDATVVAVLASLPEGTTVGDLLALDSAVPGPTLDADATATVLSILASLPEGTGLTTVGDFLALDASLPDGTGPTTVLALLSSLPEGTGLRTVADILAVRASLPPVIHGGHQAPNLRDQMPPPCDSDLQCDEDDGWTRVRGGTKANFRKKSHKKVSVAPRPPNHLILNTVHVCTTNEVVWHPKISSRRATMKWSLARKASLVGNTEGLGFFIYGSHGDKCIEY